MRLANRRGISCLTCRERKVKCSGEKPGCRTCSSSRRWCRGYGTFVGTDAGEVGYDLAPARNALRRQLLDLYLIEYLPDEIIASNKDHNWLLQISSIETLTPALEAAMFAICGAQLGQKKSGGSVDISYRSLAFYNTGLRELQKAINHPFLLYHDQTLAACLAMTMYEFSECPGKVLGGYLSHYQGLMELLKQRGAEAHTTGLGHSVLREIRVHTVFRGFQIRSASFLANKDWLDLPWALMPKDYHDQLIDIMLRLPKVMTQLSVSPITSPRDIIGPTVKRVQACWQFDNELTDWLERVVASTAGPLFWPEPNRDIEKSSPSVDTNNLPPAPYNFPNFISAQTLLFYWISRIIVAFELGLAYRLLQSIPIPASTPPYTDPECICREDKKRTISSCLLHFRPARLPPLGYRANWSETIACNIRRSVDYFFLDKLRVAGPACLVFPLMVLRFHWEHDFSDKDRNNELTWAGKTLMRIYSRASKIAEIVSCEAGVGEHQDDSSSRRDVSIGSQSSGDAQKSPRKATGSGPRVLGKTKGNPRTVSSAETTTVSTAASRFIPDLCDDIYAKVRQHTNDKPMESISRVIPGLVKAFAVKLNFSAADELSQKAIQLIHQNHLVIARRLRLLFFPDWEDEVELRKDQPVETVLIEKTSTWKNDLGPSNSKVDDALVLFDRALDGDDKECHPPDLSLCGDTITNSTADASSQVDAQLVYQNYLRFPLLFSPGSEDEVELRMDQPGGTALIDKTSKWDNDPGPENSEVSDELILFDRALDGNDKEYKPPDLSAYGDTITNSTAYHWLIKSLAREASLHRGDLQEWTVAEDVYQQILAAAPAGRIGIENPPKPYKVTFEVPCKELEARLVQEVTRQRDLSLEQAMQRVVVATSSGPGNCQVTMMRQYLDQTWSSSGVNLLRVLGQAFEKERGVTVFGSLADQGQIEALIEESNLMVSVTGDSHTIAECGEQLAWLSAAIQPASLGFIGQRRPRLIMPSADLQTDTTESPLTIGIMTELRDETSKRMVLPTSIWNDFLSVPMVQGFPTARLPKCYSGVEVSAEILLSEPAQSPKIEIYKDYILLRRARSTLKLTRVPEQPPGLPEPLQIVDADALLEPQASNHSQDPTPAEPIDPNIFDGDWVDNFMLSIPLFRVE
ncbi:hypothetical protein GQ53DRAFT_845123 [Thozetella sp. PMI_491]|nr:hypothetical protein GQ53DRAFT_845123 [Thozetella sp. PMI_491]